MAADRQVGATSSLCCTCTLKRIYLLIQEIQRSPFEGIGKPEPLVGNLSGYWSRRIDDANRLMYFADDDAVIIVNCRYHYGAK